MSDSSTVDQGAYEQEYVHQVYNKIASHFSSTRFKPWPVVDEFLRALPAGSIGLDVGCGNGKYLTVRNDVFIVASDRSSELIKFARNHQPHGAVMADTLNLPHPSHTFDFAICIAVIHHLSTPTRRQASIRAILSTLRPTLPSPIGPDRPGCKDDNRRTSGQALIFVWALEQKNSRRGWDAGHEQDVLVPWILKQDPGGSKLKKKDRNNAAEPKQGEGATISVGTSATCDSAAVNVDKEKGNMTQETSSVSTPDDSGPTSSQSQQQTYQRYYHLYREGELEDDIVLAGGRVVRNGYDRDNWWAICERIDSDSSYASG